MPDGPIRDPADAENQEEAMYELEVVLRSPERTVETSYGPRTERDVLARLEVPVASHRGWSIYQEAVAHVLRPDFILTLPEGMSDEEAEELRRKFMEKHGGRDA